MSDLFSDTYLHMELAIPREGDRVQLGLLVKRQHDRDGLPMWTAHDKPFLDSRMHEVEFLDVYKTSLAAKTIAENLFAKIEDEGNVVRLWRQKQ
jgi:hypothetical protein